MVFSGCLWTWGRRAGCLAEIGSAVREGEGRNRIPMSRKQGVCRGSESKPVGQGEARVVGVAGGGESLSKAIQAVTSTRALAAASALCAGRVTGLTFLTPQIINLQKQSTPPKTLNDRSLNLYEPRQGRAS